MHPRRGGLQKQKTGKLVPTECSMYINCLKLLGATLAVKTFAKTKTAISILLRINNTTAVSYINNVGGTASREFTRDLWMCTWCLERNTCIAAVYLPVVYGVWYMLDRTDWKLNPMIATPKYQGPLDMDLFMSRLSTQCPLYFSWQLIPFALTTDALLQDWIAMKCHVNPLCYLVGWVLAQVQSQQVQVVLVAPVWKAQQWFLTLGLIDHPLIPSLRKPMSLDPMPLFLQLAVWHISGISSEVKTFLKKL